eukprot:496379_1
MTTPSPTDLDFTLQTDERINVVLLSFAVFIAAICFATSVFYYSKKTTNPALQFTLCYKILSIFSVIILFFLLITSITSIKSRPSLTEVIMFLLILTAIIMANFIGTRDYRYSCWDNCCVSLHCNTRVKKWIIYGLITIFTPVLMILVAVSDDILLTMFFGFIISFILSFCNGISFLIAFSVIFCAFIGSIWAASQSDVVGQFSKFCLYSFPIMFVMTLFYGITSFKKQNIFLRNHIGYNTFCGLMSILNRASNYVVFFICLATNNGGIALFQLILIVFTAIISTIYVKYDELFIDERDDFDNDENNNNIKNYFLKGKCFTFFGFGRVWFDMISWDKNKIRDNIISGYHLIKIYELIFECFPSLSLQLIVSMTLFSHETIIISIIISMIYITLILFGIVYDEKYLLINAYKQCQSQQEPIIAPITETKVLEENIKENIISKNIISANVRSYASVQTNSVSIELIEPFDVSKTDNGMREPQLENINVYNMNDKTIKCKDYCSMIGFVLFIWSDFFIRIIPLWYLTKHGGEVSIYLILLYVMDIIFYWLMIAKQGGSLNKCIDILLFSWTGIITCCYYFLITMDIKYILSVGNKRFLCIEHWLRIVLNIIVTLMVNKQITAGLSFLWIISCLINLICGYKLLFGYCCGRQREKLQSV